MIFHTIFGILGPLVDPFFHALHLVLFVNISNSAMYILQACTNRLGALMNTLFMALFVIYAYSILGANYYSGVYDIEDIDACSSLASCFLYTLNFGLRNGGGVADSMKPYKYGEESKFGLKVVFDLTFFIFINIIVLNIVFGIIIDTFGEMRDASYEQEDKFKNLCIICQNQRTDIEEMGLSFKEHTTDHHDFWLYPQFIKYIEEKDKLELSADEVYVYADISAKKVDWIPHKKSLFLEEGENEGEDEQQRLLLKKLTFIEES